MKSIYKREKTGGRNFTSETGRLARSKSSGNSTPHDLRAVVKLTRHQFECKIADYMAMNKDELQALINDSTSSMLDLFIASILHKGVIQGDDKRLAFLVDRLFGKLTDKIEVKSNVHADLVLALEKYKEK